jgi:uncharacterized membrane protein
MDGAMQRPTRPERLRAHAGIRTVVAFGAGAAVWITIELFAPWPVALLVAWNVAMAVYVAWVWVGVGHLDAEATRIVATREDSSRVTADLVLILASLMNLVGLAFVLVEASGASRLAARLMNVAIVSSVGLSWAAVHTVFALRYAHLYYKHGGGIDFGSDAPDYRDFAYLAFTVGMTFQVSDTTIGSREIRRTVLRHALLSNLFSVVIVATTINVIVGLFRG